MFQVSSLRPQLFCTYIVGMRLHSFCSRVWFFYWLEHRVFQVLECIVEEWRFDIIDSLLFLHAWCCFETAGDWGHQGVKTIPIPYTLPRNTLE